jgi:hypothetical protein
MRKTEVDLALWLFSLMKKLANADLQTVDSRRRLS